MKCIWIALAILLICSVGAAPAAAQTLTSTPVQTCTVEPRTHDNLTQLASQATPPVPGVDLEPYAIWESALPVGTVADDQTVDEITNLLMVRIACAIDGDFARFSALYTDEYLTYLFAIEEVPPLDTPVPAEKPDFRLGPLEQVTQLADGRVSAFVTFVGKDVEDSQPRPRVTYLMIFKKVDGIWKIDRQYEKYVDTATQHFHPIADLLDHR